MIAKLPAGLPLWMEDEGIKLRYLIHDSDMKFQKRFVKFFEMIIEDNDMPGRSEGKVIKTAVRCPPQNGYVERAVPADSHASASIIV